MLLFDSQAEDYASQVYGRADAFLFGRLTYDLALNTRPKYVASTTLTDPQWSDTTVLSGDVAAAIGELKTEKASELQVHGSGALVRWLFDSDLVDEITRLTYPVVIGRGSRLFPETGPDRALELVETQVTPLGVTIQVYRPIGRPQYAI